MDIERNFNSTCMGMYVFKGNLSQVKHTSRITFSTKRLLFEALMAQIAVDTHNISSS